MPRLKTKLTTKKRRSLTRDKYRIYNVYDWSDPYPDVMGTMPEKMVYARLMLMQIPFYFQNQIDVNIPIANIYKKYRPDFVLPHAKIIIEVQGSYWHSKPEAIESDSYKFALYEAVGYKVLAWWDYDIESNLDKLFAQTPVLNNWKYARGGRIITARTQFRDDLKGLRTMNAKKRKPYRQFVGTSRRNVRKSRGSYAI
jgi:very-short-patch-repair endonuclease